MTEAKGTSSAAAAGTKKGTGFELRLEAAKAFVCLTDREVTAGARLVELALEVPEVKFPFEVGQGAGQFRLRLCDLARLEVEVSQPFLATLISKLDLAPAGIASLQLAFRAGFAEGAGQLEGGVPFTFKAGVLPTGDQGLSLVVYDARLYGPAFLPAAALPNLLTRAIGSLARPDGSAFELDPLPLLLRRLLPARGWKVPRTEQVRLTAARLEPGLLRLVWDRDHSGPADAPAEQDLLAAVEGARAFRAAEALLARSEWEPAREAYLAAGASAAAHPFAVSRLLSLLAMEERFQEEALDLAAEWRARKPDFVPALAAEAVLRALRGEPGRAAAAFAELAAAAQKRGEELSALTAAEACFAQGEQGDPASVTRAVEIALTLRRDHLPALRALLSTAERTGDREALMRACRRLAAYAPDGAEKARAHARLGELLLSSDPPSARLHLDQALRMAPDDAEALAALGRACERAGEHLRSARAHDRLREIFIQRGEHGAAAGEALAVGALWETQLDHPENALLRYREACELDPSSIEARERAARMADQLGHWPEAADHYAALLSTLDPSQPGSAERAARAHRALAAIAESRLEDPARAASHLEAVLASEPHDPSALEQLSKLYRKLDRPAELLAVLDRLSPLAAGPTERAALLAEAGQLALGRLHLQEAARSRFAAALTLDPRCRPALLGLIDLAASQNDGRSERDGLERLVATVRDRAEQATLHDRVAAVSERMGDLGAAFRAVAAARNAAPSLPRLGEAVRIARRMGSESVLSGLLAEQAIAARTAGESSLAAASWLERARLLAPSDLALARAAVSEARTMLPLDPAGLRLEAELAERTGDGPVALRALQALLAAAPDDAKALELRAGRAALLAGDLAAARGHADRAIALGEHEAESVLEEVLDRTGDRAGQAELTERTGRWLQAARLWMAEQEPLRARKALEQAAHEPGTAAEALGLLGELTLTAGDSSAAANAFRALAPLRGGRDGARLAFRAAALDPAHALEALDLAVRCDPTYAPARASRADRLLSQAPTRALEDAEAALAVPEADPDAPATDLRAALHRLASTAATHAGAAEPARRHLAGYCAQAPDDDAALAELIVLHRQAKALPELAAALERRLDRPGLDGAEATAARLELARLLAGPLARPADARPLLAELLSQPSPSEELVRAAFDPALSPIVDSARRAQLALRFAALPDVSPEAAAAALSERAAHLSAAPAPADWTEALETARRLLQLDPRHPLALELLARAATASHLPEEAARALLARAELARERREPDAASRSVAAGRAALAAGFGAQPAADALRTAVQLGVDRAEAAPLLAELLADPSPSDALVRTAFDPLFAPLVDPVRRAQLALRFAALPGVAPADAAAALAERAAHLSGGPAPADWTEALETARRLVQLSPRDPVALDLLARAATALQRPEEAAQALLTRAELARAHGEPDAPSRLVTAGHAALAAGLGSEVATGVLQTALQLGVNHAEAAALLSELLADPHPADALVQTAFDPRFAPLVDPIRRAQLARRFASLPGVAPADAVRALAEQVALLSSAPEPPGPINWSDAIETACTLVQLAPDHAGGLELLARAADALHRPEEAAQALLARAELARDRHEPDAPSRLVTAGHAALAAGLGSDLATGALRTALQLGVNHAEAAPLLAELLADPNPSGELIQTAFDPLFAPLVDPAQRGRLALRFASLSDVDPADATAALAEQVTFLSSAPEPIDWSEALQTARKLVQLSPRHARGLELLAQAALALQRSEEAAQALLARAALARDQSEPDAAARYAAASRAAIDAGLGTEAAVEALQTAVDLGLDRDQAAPLLGELLSDPSPSDALVRAAFDPRFAPWVDPARRSQLALRFAALPGVAAADAAAALSERVARFGADPEPSDWGDALETARRLLQLTPSDTHALELLARASAALGQPAEAARALLARAELARTQGEPDAASRLAAAGHAALAAGLERETVAGALRSAVQLQLDRDEARAAWTVLARLAVQAGDAAAERSALEALLPLLRTGDKPACLLRLSALALADRDLEAARRSADEARQLAPRELDGVEACRLVALEQGDLSAVVECLATEAALDPDRAGARLLERARVLAGPLGRLDEADQAYEVALAKLPPDSGLAMEHVRLRRRAPDPVHARSWSEPIERFAQRASDRRGSAPAFLRAATLALAQNAPEAALRCARTAYARTHDTPAFAGPLLARILYHQGAAGEALVLHQRLFDEAWAAIDEGDQVALCRQLAELADDQGDRDLAVAALDRLLALRPQDAEAAERRFDLDPDRARAVKSLAQVAGASRSGRARLRALLRAAAAAYGELHDAPRAGELWRRARVETGGATGLAAAVENARLETIRGDSDPFAPQIPAEQVEALEDAAAAWKEAGELETTVRLLEEAADLHGRYGQFTEAVQDLEQLEELALERSDAGRAAGYARSAGLILLDHAGDLDGAELAIRRAVGHEPSDRDTWRLLEAIARARGVDGAPLLVEALSALAELAPDPLLRANTLVTLAAVQETSLGDLDAAAAVLERALAEVPGLPGAEEPLARILRSQGHLRPLAELLLSRAARAEDPAERSATRREAAELLEGLSDREDLTLAAESYALASADAPDDTELSRAAARLLVELGRREEAIPHLAALVRADPDDEAAARELAQAFAGRHRERADLFLARASRARGEPRAARLREAAKALFAAGDDVRARALLREAYDAWPADDTAFLGAIRDAAADIDRLDAVLGARAAAVPSEAAGCHRARADALLAFGRVGEAERAYEACLVAAPDDAGALAMLAECRAEHEGDEAAASADTRLCVVAEANPGSVTPSVEARARYRLGLSAWAHGRPSEGIAHLERALALAPDDARAGLALAALANGHAARNNGDAALSAARARVARAERMGLTSEQSEALEAGVALAAQFGDHGSDAAVLLEELATVRVTQGGEPDPSTDALVERAVAALLRGGESARAEALLTIAARASQGMRRADLFLRLADTARGRGEHSAARAARAEADAADPAGATLRLGPLEDVKASGDLTAYAAALEQALAAPDGDAAACTLELARTRSYLGDPAGAAKAYESLLDMGPEARGFAEASAALVSHYEQSGNAPALAAVHTRRATAAITAQERAAAHLAAAAVLERSGADPAETRSALEQACEADADDVAPWLARAAFESRSGDPLSAARAHLAVAIRAEKGEASQAALEAARLFESLGRTADASRAYTAAIHADPRCLPARRALAARALEQGDPACAAAHLAAIPDAELPPSERPAHLRALAQALQAAGREAGPAWRAAFDADPGEPETFEKLARGAKVAGDLETWLELAQAHRAALLASGDTARRETLDLERAEVLTSLGRSEASVAPPEREQPDSGLDLALPRAPEPAAAEVAPAPELVSELASTDPFAPAGALHSEATAPDTAEPVEPRRRAIVPEREPNPLEAALAGASLPPEALELVPDSEPVPVAELELPELPPSRRDTDVVADVLRAQANASDGSARAECLERLATHLERNGDRSGAADALREALETDPDRDLTYARLLSIASGDRERFVAAVKLRASRASDPGVRSAALCDLGQMLLRSPETYTEALKAFRFALELDPGSASAARGLEEARVALADVGELPPPAPAPSAEVRSGSDAPPLGLQSAIEEAARQADLSAEEPASAEAQGPELAAPPPAPTVEEPAPPLSDLPWELPPEPAVAEPAALEPPIPEPSISEPTAFEPAAPESAAPELTPSEQATFEPPPAVDAQAPDLAQPHAPAVEESLPPLSDLPWELPPEPAAFEPPIPEPSLSEPTSAEQAAFEPPPAFDAQAPELAEPHAPAVEESLPPLSDLPWELPPEPAAFEPPIPEPSLSEPTSAEQAAFEPPPASDAQAPDLSEPPAPSVEAPAPPPSDLTWESPPDSPFVDPAAELLEAAIPPDAVTSSDTLGLPPFDFSSPEQATARVLDEIDLDLSELDLPILRNAPEDRPSFDLDLAGEPGRSEPPVNLAAEQEDEIPAAPGSGPAALEEDPSLPGGVEDWNFSDLTAAASSAAAQAVPPELNELPPVPAAMAEEPSLAPETPAPLGSEAAPDPAFPAFEDPVPEEPAVAEQRIAEALQAEEAQELERARELYEQAWAADPHSVPALTGLCRVSAASEDGGRLLELTHALETLAGPSALEPFGAAIGRAYLAIGELEPGHAWLEATWAANPTELSLAQDLYATAETLGRFEQVVQLGDVLASGFAESDPASAVAYYRHSGEVARDQLADLDRAAIFFEKALALAPDDADLHRALTALQAPPPEAAPQSLTAVLDVARRTPFDGDAVAALAALARRAAEVEPDAEQAGRLRELARAASGLAGFVSPGLSTSDLPRPATHVTPELRERAAFPARLAEMGRLVTLLSPFLEPLFPANLARRGVTAQDRISERRAPTLHERLGLTAHVLGCRPYAAFLSQSTSCDVHSENTQPPALVLGVGAVAALAPSALAFLLARSLVLLDHGWALLGKFSPRDVAILCELACRFAGGRPPSLGLPPERAGSFLTVLERTVPGAVRAQAKAHAQIASEELEHFDASTFTQGIAHTANRVAVLYTGDPRGALEALSRLGHAEGITPELADPAQVLARPEPAELVRFVLSDLYLELRGAVLV